MQQVITRTFDYCRCKYYLYILFKDNSLRFNELKNKSEFIKNSVKLNEYNNQKRKMENMLKDMDMEMSYLEY